MGCSTPTPVPGITERTKPYLHNIGAHRMLPLMTSGHVPRVSIMILNWNGLEDATECYGIFRITNKAGCL
jgi:hypothetical protein